MESMTQTEVGTRELLRLFDEVLPFADKGDWSSQLNSIGLESDGDHLVAVATDRYTLGASRLLLDEPITLPAPCLLGLSDVARVKRIFRPERRAQPTLRLTFSESGLIVEETSTLSADLPTLRLGCPWVESAAVPYRKILNGGANALPADATAGFNPAFIARFAAAQRDREPMQVWTEGPGKLWKITLGDHFVGAIMPVRMESDAPAPWTPSEEPAKAKRGKKAAA